MLSEAGLSGVDLGGPFVLMFGLMKRSLRIRARFSEENDVTLSKGDCLKLLSNIPDEAAQLVVTSPPYNVGKSYEKKQTLKEYLDAQKNVIREVVRIIRPGGSICWQVGNHINGHQQIVPLDFLVNDLFSSYRETASIRLRNRIVWHFEHGLHCRLRFSGRYETVLWYTKGDEYTFNLDSVRVPQKYPGKRAYQGPKRGQYSGNPNGKNPGDVWVFPNVKSNHVEKTVHPCQFPVELPARLVSALTNPGDLVVDPYLGVGTTAVAAVLSGRRAAGADVVAEYVTIARNRVKLAANGKLRFRPIAKPVYVPAPNKPLTTRPPHFAA